MVLAKANILKLLKFDDDIRDAIIAGRRLRNCTLHQKDSINPTLQPSELCFIGISLATSKSGTAAAAAASLSCINPNESIKSEIERLTRGTKLFFSPAKNKLSESLLDSTVWAITKVNQDQAAKIGAVRAGQIALLKAIDSVINKLNPAVDSIVIVMDEHETIAGLKYAQMAVANGQERSASVATAFTVAGAYGDILAKQAERAKQAQSFTPQPKMEDFTPPSHQSDNNAVAAPPPAVPSFR